MSKYRVTYEYHGKVVVDVEADSEESAEELGQEEADGAINNALELYSVKVREIVS